MLLDDPAVESSLVMEDGDDGQTTAKLGSGPRGFAMSRMESEASTSSMMLSSEMQMLVSQSPSSYVFIKWTMEEENDLVANWTPSHPEYNTYGNTTLTLTLSDMNPHSGTGGNFNLWQNQYTGGTQTYELRLDNELLDTWTVSSWGETDILLEAPMTYHDSGSAVYTITAAGLTSGTNWQVLVAAVGFAGPPELQQATFAAAEGGFPTVFRDDGTAAYSAPHWKYEPEGDDREHPVAYTSGSTMQVTINVSSANIGAFDEVRVRGRREGSVEFDEISINTPHDGFQSTLERNSAFADNTILYFDTFDVDWEVKLGNGPWISTGMSKNRVFVVGGNPAWAFETVFDVGTRNAHGMSPAQEGQPEPGASQADLAVADAIWADFENLEVKNAEGDIMLYWGPASSIDYTQPPHNDPQRNDENFTVEGLLKHKDGRCEAWGRFLLQVLQVQGLNPVLLLIETPALNTDPPLGHPIHNEDFFVVDFLRHGQGNIVPGNNEFTNHVVVGFNSPEEFGYIIYDPSYGIRKQDPIEDKVRLQWEVDAIQIFVAEWVDGQGSRVYVPVDNDEEDLQTIWTPQQ